MPRQRPSTISRYVRVIGASLGTSVDTATEVGLKEYVRVHTARLERALIVRSLEQEGGNVTRAARRLDISRKSLQLKMKEYQLREEPE